MGHRGQLSAPALVVHGGAGRFERAGDLGRLESDLEAALAAGWSVLEAGGAALDAAVEAVAWLEDTGRFNAGRGSVKTTAGSIETDACVVDGESGATGAVCAATWPANPVRVARALADRMGDASEAGHRPVLLAGPGADDFARSLPGHGPMPAPAAGAPPPPSAEGTVGAVALDGGGRLAAATSTGGRAGQVPGRVGDSAVVGAGTWADNATVALSATGAGEAFLRAGFGHRTDVAVRQGVPLDEAVTGGLVQVAALGGEGGVIALDPSGILVAAFDTPAMAVGWRDSAGGFARVASEERPLP